MTSPNISGGILNIDLDALIGNWRLLKSRLGGVECAAAIKADGYGLGARRTVVALAGAGCGDFFVALIDEGIHIRAALDEDGLARYRRDHVGIVFQNFYLVPTMTALENVMIGAERTGNLLVQHNEDSLRERAMSALTFVGLGPRANELVSSFSYGHQRLIEIARALAANPTLLLLDEPAAGLNSSEKVELHGLLKRIADQGLTILIIDHDMALVREAAQHITVLNFGRRIADGESLSVLQQPDVISAYLGTE